MSLIKKDGFTWFVPENFSPYFGTSGHEEPLLSALRNLKWDGAGTFIDVGASVGLYTLHLARFFRRVFALEPYPPTFKVLQENLRLNSLDHVVAVNKAAYCNFDTLTPPTNLFMAPNTDFGRLKIIREPPGIPAEGITIDSLGIEDCQLVKVDVEGTGGEVVQGAMRTLDRPGCLVQIELHTDGEDSLSSSILSGLGFTTTGQANYGGSRYKVWRRGS